AALPAVAATIGNFDGVHLGHQAMLGRLGAAARARHAASCVLTFEPHPREFFSPASAPTRLSSLREKCALLDAHGVERVHVLRFDRALAALAPDAFVREILVRALKARWVLVGEDFRFGARRAGDAALLRRLAEAQGVEVETMPNVTHAGQRVSSWAARWGSRPRTCSCGTTARRSPASTRCACMASPTRRSPGWRAWAFVRP